MINILFTFTPLKYLTQSLWRDEGFSYLLARQDLITIITTTARDFNPPLYYILLHYWMSLFGTTEVVMRSLSVIFFAINIYIVYLFLKNIFKVSGRRIWHYLFFFAANPLLLYYAFEARMYSLLALLATVSYYFFYRQKWRLFVVSAILGLYSHYYFIFVLITQFFLTIFSIKKKNFFKTTAPYWVPLITFVPWFIYLAPFLRVNTTDFWLKKTRVYDIFISPGVLFTGYERNYFNFYDHFIGFISVLLLLAVIMFFIKSKKNNLPVMLIFWSFLGYYFTLFISIFKPIFISRYLIFSTVGFSLLLVYIFENINKKLSILTMIVFWLIIVSYWSGQLRFRNKGDSRKIISEIKYLAKDGDKLYLTDPSRYFVASYYYNEDDVYIYNKKYSETPKFIGLVLIPKNKFVTSLPKYPQKAFILASEANYEIKTDF